MASLPPKRYSGRGQPPSRPRRGKGHKSVPVKKLAFSLPQDAWHTVTWREGSTGLHALTRARGTPPEFAPALLAYPTKREDLVPSFTTWAVSQADLAADSFLAVRLRETRLL
jgi:hypothetical protein